MSEIKFTLTGWKAVLVLVAFGGFGAWRMLSAYHTLDTEARAHIESQLEARYLRMTLGEIGESLPTEAQVEELMQAGTVEIRSLSARGTPDDMVVKVEASVDGGMPPDGEPVSYWRVTHSTILGWRVERETTALRWWLALL